MSDPLPDLVLVGGGHSHVQVLRMHRMEPLLARVTVVVDHSVAVYSGMVPGVVSGQYAPQEVDTGPKGPSRDFCRLMVGAGKVYRKKVYELPEGTRTARGSALVNLLPLREGERVMAVIPTREFKENRYIVFATAVLGESLVF